MAARDSARVRFALESLEARLPLSGGFPLNSIGSSAGAITSPKEVASASVAVSQHNLTPYKSTTIFGVFIQPGAGSELQPRIVRVTENGARVPFKEGRPFGLKGNEQTAAFVKLDRPGPLSVTVAGRKGTTGTFTLDVTLGGDINGAGAVSPADLPLFAAAYMSRAGQPNYNAAADFNQNGRVNLYDAMVLEHNMPPESVNKPLQVLISLPKSEQTPPPTSSNSGGQTYDQYITILGHTTPGSLVITDPPAEAYTFNGKAYPVNQQGNFAIPAKNTLGINIYDLLILDPFGRKLIQSYPVFWNAYARPDSPYPIKIRHR